jgi:hypothetical protein
VHAKTTTKSSPSIALSISLTPLFVLAQTPDLQDGYRVHLLCEIYRDIGRQRESLCQGVHDAPRALTERRQFLDNG